MRVARKQSSLDLYHVMARGTGRQLIFECDDDRAVFLGLLASAQKETSVELFAWCLMDNHFHLLVHAPIESVSQLMKRLCGNYARHFNGKCDRVGHLFQERFKSEPIEDEGYLLTVLRYIHQNPVEANMGAVDTYEWSSYREYLDGPRYCATDFIAAFFDSDDAYVSFHRESGKAHCLDVGTGRNKTRAMSDESASLIAKDVLGTLRLADLKAEEVGRRNALIVELLSAGLSIRQLERLTGIGRGSIARAWAARDK